VSTDTSCRQVSGRRNLKTLPPGVYYVTRDSDCEGLAIEFVDVWNEAPVRVPRGDGVLWLPEDLDMERTHLGTYLLEGCKVWIGTVPDDDRQVLRVDRG
jgi:hypothetical protein